MMSGVEERSEVGSWKIAKRRWRSNACFDPADSTADITLFFPGFPRPRLRTYHLRSRMAGGYLARQHRQPAVRGPILWPRRRADLEREQVHPGRDSRGL